MAEGGKIYTKTIDSSVQDGIDNNLIIQPNYAYQKKFPFGSDWTKIKIGMFWSYTNSVTDDNKAFTSGQADVDSGATSNDTYSWFGIINDTVDKGIPLSDGINFAGARFHRLRSIESLQFYTSTNTIVDDTSHGDNYPRFVTTKDTTYIDLSRENVSTGAGKNNHIPFTRADLTSGFADYIGLEYTVSNKGLTNQYLTIRQSTIDGSSWNNTKLTDISLVNLKNIMNGANEDLTTITTTDGDASFDWDGSSALPLPDSIFFYNAFLTVRPRIHAIAVKKIS